MASPIRKKETGEPVPCINCKEPATRHKAIHGKRKAVCMACYQQHRRYGSFKYRRRRFPASLEEWMVVKKLVKIDGWSYREIAEHFGVHKNTVSKKFMKKHEPHFD